MIENAKKKIIQTIEDIEKIAYGLRPSMIDTLGLVPSLRDLFAEIKQHKKIEVHFFTRDIPKRFDQEKELAIFRVVQEALTNIIKHSQAKKCFVNLVKEGNFVALSVEDDGIGFTQEKKWDMAIVNGRIFFRTAYYEGAGGTGKRRIYLGITGWRRGAFVSSNTPLGGKSFGMRFDDDEDKGAYCR